MRANHAPCGHDWRSDKIVRTFRGTLWPTIWSDCRCRECGATWTERYEFDFSVPINGNTNEAQAYADIPTAIGAISGGGNTIHVQAGANYTLTTTIAFTAALKISLSFMRSSAQVKRSPLTVVCLRSKNEGTLARWVFVTSI